MVPVASSASGMVFITGYPVEDGWEITGLDWDTLFATASCGPASCLITSIPSPGPSGASLQSCASAPSALRSASLQRLAHWRPCHAVVQVLLLVHVPQMTRRRLHVVGEGPALVELRFVDHDVAALEHDLEGLRVEAARLQVAQDEALLRCRPPARLGEPLEVAVDEQNTVASFTRGASPYEGPNLRRM